MGVNQTLEGGRVRVGRRHGGGERSGRAQHHWILSSVLGLVVHHGSLILHQFKNYHRI